ncbi:BL1S4-like protein [Mya arenaria]|uniref:BL1S4-like protein n=1 Tax=Mya arenaria TaxID=6604 RepID=A0ABY7EVV6_MYAAR|nr:BL1S4-like protein [Mya arenaria]
MTDSDPTESRSADLTSCLPDLANDFTGYLDKQAFYHSIDEMLTKLDEFGGLVDSIRSDTSLCVETNVRNIQTKCEQMKQIFARVDQLEAFVSLVKQNVNTVEECVNKAESDMSSFPSLKKVFSSLVGSKKQSQNKEKLTFNPPDIFLTEDFITPVQSVVKIDQSMMDTSGSKSVQSKESDSTEQTSKDG